MNSEKKAIQRYLQGEKPKAIYTDLNRSKKWFLKWLKRYQTGQKDWYKDQPRAPRNIPRRITESNRQRIIQVRQKLESEPYAQIGASAIKWELSKAGFDFPSDRTIHRVLKHEGLVKKKLHIFPKELSIRILLKLSILITFIRPILLARARLKAMVNLRSPEI